MSEPEVGEVGEVGEAERPRPSTPPPERILAARLELRRWAVAEAPLMRAAIDRSDAHLRPWVPFMRDEPRTPAQTEARVGEFLRDFASGRAYRYAAWLREPSPGAAQTLTGEVLLMTRAGPRALELGYWFDVAHSGRGYASEACRALVARAFAGDFGDIDRVLICCDVGNAPSNAVARKLGASVLRHEQVEALSGVGEDTLAVWELRRAGFEEAAAAAAEAGAGSGSAPG